MKNNKTILATAILLVLIFGIYYFATRNKRVDNNEGLFDKLQSLYTCAKEGERVRETGAGFPTRCCAGLKGMYGYARTDCGIPSFEGDIGTCSDCGNGDCEPQNNEHKCNCPADCAGVEPAAVNTKESANAETGYQNDCEKSGGIVSEIEECDGSRSAWCELSEAEQCYTDQVSDGKCPENISPRVLCDYEQ